MKNEEFENVKVLKHPIVFHIDEFPDVQIGWIYKILINAQIRNSMKDESTTKNLESVKHRVKKLLALSEAPHEAEAESAMDNCIKWELKE